MAEPTLKTVPAEILAWGNQFFGTPEMWSAVKQSGGINNHVYLCHNEDQRMIVKCYAQTPAPGQDRFRAEKEFLTFANTCASAYVPRLIAADSDRRLLIMEAVEGKPYREGQPVSEQDIQNAASFTAELLHNTELAKQYISQSAADGFLRLTEHLGNVQVRIADMTTTHLPENCVEAAEAALRSLRDRLSSVHTETSNAISRELVIDAVEKESLCPSPSDFGFHNAIATSDSVKFIDFEFAGWDDPAKLVCDVFLQPRIPVSAHHQNQFEDAAASVVPRNVLRTRIQYLKPILHLKWTTIILAVLRPRRLESLLDVNPSQPRDGLIQERLRIAHRYLQNGVHHGVR